MPPAARQPLGGWRNEPCLIAITVPNLDLTGKTVRAQLRPTGDNPVLTLDLPMTADPNATGIRLVSVTVDPGTNLPTSHLMWQITEAGMQSLPYAGELGDPWIGTYALQIAGKTRMFGAFAAMASPIDSDAAPANRAPGYGAIGTCTVTDGVVLTIGDGGVTVSIDSADLIAPVVAAATQALATTLAAEASALAAKAKAELARDTSTQALAAVLAALAGHPIAAPITLNAVTRVALAQITTQIAEQRAYLTERGRSGWFSWKAFDVSVGVTADPLQAVFVAPASDPSGKSGAWVRDIYDRVFYANWWGMVADGADDGSGTDNVPPFQGCLDAVKAFGGGTVKILPGHYCYKGPLRTVTGGSMPAQVFLPATDLPGGDTAELSITIMGDSPPGSYILNPKAAVILHSTLTGTGGAFMASKSISNHPNGALAAIYLKNLGLRGQPNPGITMLDALYIPILDVKSVTCDVAGLGNGRYVEPTYDDVWAIRGPQNNVPLWNRYDDLVIYGWNTGIQPGELFRFGDVNVSHCKWAFHLVENQHPGVIERAVVTSIENVVKVTGACMLERAFFDIEHASRPGWMDVTVPFTGYDVYDPNAFLRNPNDSPALFHLHDGTPLNVLGNNLKWQQTRPWQFGSAFNYIFPDFQKTVDHRSLQELVATPGKPAWHSLVAYDPAPNLGQPFGVWSASNMAGAAPFYIRGQINFYYDKAPAGSASTGSPDSVGFQLWNAKNGVARKVLDINSDGVMATPLGLIAAANDADAASKGVPVNGWYRIGNTPQIRIA